MEIENKINCKKSELPLHWYLAFILQVADVIPGIGFPTIIQGKKTGKYPFFKVGDISRSVQSGNRYLLTSENYIDDRELEQLHTRPLPENTIVFAKIGESLKLNRRAITTKSALVDNNVVGIKGNKDVIQNLFLFFFLQTINLGDYSRATTVPSVRKSDIEQILIPLPPLNEQHRIVDKIEELFSDLDVGIENLKTARSQLKIYRQSVLKWAFEGKLTAEWRQEQQRLGKLQSAEELLAQIKVERENRYQQQVKDWEKSIEVWEANGKADKKPTKPQMLKNIEPINEKRISELPELPNGWLWIPLGNANVDISDGPFGSNLKTSDYVDSGIRVVRLENIGVLKFFEHKESYVSEEKYELLKKHTVLPGDIVFASFITDDVRVTLFPTSIEKAINKSDCFCIRFFDNSLINSFVVMYLSTRNVYKQLEILVHGVGRPRINTTQLKDVAIPVCSAVEQQLIIADVESRLSICDQLETTIEENLQRAESLRQSILKQAFAGKLVPQDPNDEPATKLLARIQQEQSTQQTLPLKPRKPAKKTP
jgi:type I restriction enzyme, S subunit